MFWHVSVCLSTGGYPFRSSCGGTPTQPWTGGYPTWPGVAQPGPVRGGGGSTLARSRWGYPARSDGGTLARSRWGVPQLGLTWGYPRWGTPPAEMGHPPWPGLMGWKVPKVGRWGDPRWGTPWHGWGPPWPGLTGGTPARSDRGYLRWGTPRSAGMGWYPPPAGGTLPVQDNR